MIHTLVLAAFVGPRPAGLDTRHLDGDPTNNALANLVYGTRSENMRDKRRHGTDPNVNKTVCKQGHPFDAANTRWTPDGKRACRRCSRISVARRNVRIGRDWPACHALVAEYGEKWAS